MLPPAKRPRVAISAASSFTGAWIARAFFAAGWTVLPVCARPHSTYSGVRRARIDLIRECVPVHFECEATDGSLAAWIRNYRPDVWIHHHHWMENFRSPDYDLNRALKSGLGTLPEILDAVARGNGRCVIYSGTYFEPGERGQVWQRSQPTPYARSKAQIWEALCHECDVRGLHLAKIVIPNPIGPLENEDRLIPCMIRHAETGGALQLRSPGQLADYLPIADLSAQYVKLATQILTGCSNTVIRPAGRISSTLDWVQFAAAELLEKRLGLPPLKLDLRSGNEEHLSSCVPNPATPFDSIDWSKTWDFYARGLRRLRIGRIRFAA
jgi:UDP-glucose 4-epimerase